MAFVYRTVNQNNYPNSTTPGPGAYFQPKKYKLSQQQSIAPFNKSQSRLLWKIPSLPGPGAYQFQSSLKKQKKLASDPTGQIAIFQQPSQSVAFKSKTIRFVPNNNSTNPGPGEYELQSSKQKPLSASKVSNRSGNQLKQFLKKKNQGNYSQCGSTQIDKQIIISPNNNNKNLSFVQHQQNNESKQQTDTIKFNKNSVFFASKVQRQINKKRPQTSLGPGSYNINRSTFKVEKNYQKKSPSKSICCVQRKSNKVQTEQIGPGYYEIQRAYKNLSQSNLIKKKNMECFGSTVDRFQTFKNDIKAIAPGPAHYELLNKQPSQPIKKSATIKTTFPKEQRLIFAKPYSTISPTYYQTEKNISQTVKQKYRRNPSINECFGTTKSRFEQKQQTNSSNLQLKQCNSSINLLLKNDKQKENNLSRSQNNIKKSFKNLMKRNQQKKYFEANQSIQTEENMVDFSSFRPFCYDTESNTLQSKYSLKTQKQAPFMSCAERFKDNTSPRYIDLTSNNKNNKSQGKQNKTIKKTGQYKSKLMQKSKKKLGWMEASKDSRFKYEQQKNEKLGPQYYDPVKPQKKSYNILFS